MLCAVAGCHGSYRLPVDQPHLLPPLLAPSWAAANDRGEVFECKCVTGNNDDWGKIFKCKCVTGKKDRGEIFDFKCVTGQKDRGEIFDFNCVTGKNDRGELFDFKCVTGKKRSCAGCKTFPTSIKEKRTFKCCIPFVHTARLLPG